MVAFKGVLAMTLLAGLVHSQDDVYTAYSPGQYSRAGGQGAYRATPRLVPVKVRVPPTNISPFSYPHEHKNAHHTPYQPHPSASQQSLRFYQNPRHFESQRYQEQTTSSPSYLTSTAAASRPQHVRIRSRPYYLEEGQPLRAGTLKRVRASSLSPAPYALDQPIEFTHRVPAVATYKPSGVSPYQQQQATLAQNQQPAYYVPRTPQYQPQPQHQPQQQHGQRPVLRKVPAKGFLPEAEELEQEYASDPNPQYNFAFDVKDDDLTNYQNRQETRDDKGITKGSYSVVDPDGYVRTVTYEASPKGGFVAKVTREPTDVKIKFPEAYVEPEQGQKGGQQAYAPQQQQQQQYQPAPAYNQPGPSYSPQQQQPAYVPRGRFPQPQQGRLSPRYQ